MAVIGGVECKAHYLAMDLPHSDGCFVIAFPAETTEAWAFEGDCNPAFLVSNTCGVKWPPRSKKRIVIPEVDRGAWFRPQNAAIYMRRTTGAPVAT